MFSHVLSDVFSRVFSHVCVCLLSVCVNTCMCVFIECVCECVCFLMFYLMCYLKCLLMYVCVYCLCVWIHVCVCLLNVCVNACVYSCISFAVWALFRCFLSDYVGFSSPKKERVSMFVRHKHDGYITICFSFALFSCVLFLVDLIRIVDGRETLMYFFFFLNLRPGIVPEWDCWWSRDVWCFWRWYSQGPS